MSARRKLIRKTLIFCAAPVLVVGAAVILTRQTPDAPYVAGKETDGITRSLDRAAGDGSAELRFTEVTAQAGIDFTHFPGLRTSQLPEDMGGGVAWGDYDGDGWPDLFLVGYAAPMGADLHTPEARAACDRLYRNRGDGTFEDVTLAAGVAEPHRGMAASWADYDSDGDLDLLVSGWGELILHENLGEGTFRNVAREAGLSGDGFWAGVSWADADLDGDLDFYVCGYVDYEALPYGMSPPTSGAAEFPFTINPSSHDAQGNRFFVNQGDGTFVDRVTEAGVECVGGKSLTCAWADFNADGRPDLYVANDVSDNALFLNRGDGTFDNVSYEALVADYRGAMGIGIGDWDGDLDLDLFVTHWIAQENALYSSMITDLSAPGEEAPLEFMDDADRVGLGQSALDLIGWGTGFVDFDNDSRLDLFVANGSTFQDPKDLSRLLPMDPHLYWNAGAEEGFFEIGEQAGIRTDPPGVGRGAAHADYDRDGDQDLIILRHGGRARLLRNDSDGGHWIGLLLKARSGHASGLGARVIAYAGGKALLREAGAGPSYLSQNDPEVRIGLGDAALVDSLIVSWPGGPREAWTRLDADRRWIVEEGVRPKPVGPRVSDVSGKAVVADMRTTLTRDEIRRFWDLRKQADRLFGSADWVAAAQRYGEMLALDSVHEDALYYRGNCFLELARYREARDAWEALTRVNPSSSRAWLQLGIVYSIPEAGGLFDLARAAAAFEQAHDINREESGSLVRWGEVELARGNRESAGRILRVAHEMNPRSTSALLLSAYLARENGRGARSGELLERAAASLEKMEQVEGVAGEGDTRSDKLSESGRRAERRRLFSACVRQLARAPRPLDGEVLFACVEEEIREMSAAR